MKQLTALPERPDSVTDKALKKELLDAYGDGVARSGSSSVAPHRR